MVDPIVLEDVLSHIHNWFERDVLECGGISDGSLPESVEIPTGAWYRVEGSLLNDGLHLHPASDLTDETFDGTVTVLAIPRPLLRLTEEIGAWIQSYGDASSGPYQSESFGGYSYTLRADQNGSGGLTGWRLAFRDRLNAFRKIS